MQQAVLACPAPAATPINSAPAVSGMVVYTEVTIFGLRHGPSLCTRRLLLGSCCPQRSHWVCHRLCCLLDSEWYMFLLPVLFSRYFYGSWKMCLRTCIGGPQTASSELFHFKLPSPSAFDAARCANVDMTSPYIDDSRKESMPVGGVDRW